MKMKMAESETVHEIRREIAAFLGSRSNLPVTAEHATEKLLAKSLDLEEISRRREAFATHPEIDRTAVLANYELLHGIKFIDRLRNDEDHAIDARCIIAIFRGAEICLNNLCALAGRVADDIRHSRAGDAAINVSWMNYFNETLYRFSQLLVQMDLGRQDGDSLSIEDSETHSRFLAKMQAMHAVLEAMSESADDLARNDIDDPRRFTFFHAFVNTNYETIWSAGLRCVRVPGVRRAASEGGEQFYRRLVQNDDVRDAVTCVDLCDATHLMQFRAYHQVSEILVGLVNDAIAEAVLALADASQTSLGRHASALALCNKLLQIVTDNIKPIVRTLSPKAYSAIRPALGITSGSHSHNLRRGLFLTLYPLLVRALRLRLAGFDDAAARDDEAVSRWAQQALRGDDAALAATIRQAVCVYQAVRTWRDEHMQFVKTQIGVSPDDVTPTASISGAENAARSAHGFRSAHASDPVRPLYEAVLGKRPPAPFEIVHPGGFDETMAKLTSEAVKTMYADVQQRARRKRDHDAGALS